jgi:hypothetical protein
LLPWHAPAWQVSVCVQALPSSQAGPVSPLQVPSMSAPVAMEHASQGPAWHAELQQTASAQNPLAHWALVVHGSPSSPKG